jgi:two-component system CitB family sensor kinase
MARRRSTMRRRSTRLYTRILVSQLAVLVVATGLGFGLFARMLRNNLYSSYEHQALTVAQAAAESPAIRQAMANGDPNHTVALLAEHLRAAVGASYVVVIDRSGVRHSHPEAALIGQPVTEPVVALDGKDHVGIDHGNLGLSANGKAPLRAPDGRIIGEVSAGILVTKLSATLSSNLVSLVLYAVVAVAVGAAASLILTRGLKRQTFGLELNEIAGLLQEREATLHGIREGVVATDPEGRVSLINDEARKVLGSTSIVPHQPLADALPPGRLRDILAERTTELVDEPVLTDDRALVVNRKAVQVGGVDLGSVVTLRDRTEVVGLLGELNGIKNFADALRAQQHEHANRMHVLAGLLELGRYDEAAQYLSEVSASSAGIAETLKDNIGDPTIVALVLAKIAGASERGVQLRVEASGSAGGEKGGALADADIDPGLVVTVLGNLIDNAIDAVAGQPGAEVRVSLHHHVGQWLVIEVADNGPGVADPTLVFVDGYTTKPSTPDQPRGVGLALVQKLVRRDGGDITVLNDGGAVFTVSLPIRARQVVHRL